MAEFGKELLEAIREARVHARGEIQLKVHKPLDPREVRKVIKLTQKQMAPLMGKSLSGYRKWEQGWREVSGPVEILIRIMAREPELFLRTVLNYSGNQHHIRLHKYKSTNFEHFEVP